MKDYHKTTILLYIITISHFFYLLRVMVSLQIFFIMSYIDNNIYDYIHFFYIKFILLCVMVSLQTKKYIFSVSLQPKMC